MQISKDINFNTYYVENISKFINFMVIFKLKKTDIILLFDLDIALLQ